MIQRIQYFKATPVCLLLVVSTLVSLATCQYVQFQNISTGTVSSLTSLFISDDNSNVYVGTADNKVRVYSLGALSPTQTFTDTINAFSAMAVTSDKLFLAVADSFKHVMVYKLGAGTYGLFQTFTFTNNIQAIAFDANGSKIAMADGTQIDVYEFATTSFISYQFIPFAYTVKYMKLSNDSQLLLVNNAIDFACWIYKDDGSQYLLHQKLTDATTTFLWANTVSRDKNFIVTSGNDFKLRIYRLDASTGLYSLIQAFSQAGQWIHSITISSDNCLIYASSHDRWTRSYYQTTGRQFAYLQKISANGTICKHSIFVSKDGTYLFEGDNNGYLRAYKHDSVGYPNICPIICTIQNCATCGSNTTCQTCSGVLMPSLDGQTCVGCTVRHINCTTCVGAVCTACIAGYALGTTLECQLCNVSLVGCTLCTDNLTCTSCTQQYVLNATYCEPCSSYIVGCILCSSSSVCLTCQSGYYLNGASCSLCMTGCLICNDGVSCVTCDQNHTLSNSKCYANVPTTITLVSTIKDPNSNAFTSGFIVQPQLPPLSLPLKSYFKIMPTDCTVLDAYIDPVTTLVFIKVGYTQSLEDKLITVYFEIPDSSRNASSTFKVKPDNNLALISEDSSTYDAIKILQTFTKVVSGAGLAVFVFSIYASKPIGIQMMGVLQLAYLGLLLLDPIPIRVGPLLFLTTSNGVNSMFENIKKYELRNPLVFERIWTLGFDTSLSFSFNYMFIIFTLHLLLPIVSYVLSKLWKTRSEFFQKLTPQLLCQYLINIVLFFEYHLITAFIVFLRYAHSSNQHYLIMSICTAVLYCSAFCFTFLIYDVPSAFEYFGEYKTILRNNPRSRLHYRRTMLQRLFFPLILLFGGFYQYSGYIFMVVPLLMAIFIQTKHPYKKGYINIRAVINELFRAIIFGLYGFVRTQSDGRTSALIVTTVILVLLAITVILNLVCMIKDKLERREQMKVQAQRLVQPSHKTMSLNSGKLPGMSTSEKDMSLFESFGPNKNPGKPQAKFQQPNMILDEYIVDF